MCHWLFVNTTLVAGIFSGLNFKSTRQGTGVLWAWEWGRCTGTGWEAAEMGCKREMLVRC